MSAKVIADSISPDGVRITTFEVRFRRFVLAEFNTHRVFDRNSASSRAIPLSKQLQRIVDNLAYPEIFPTEQKGMQGGEELSEYAQQQARLEWEMAADDAMKHAMSLHALGHEADEKVHKSVANRLLEPFMWHDVVVTSTAYENFFDQRCSPLAQPEIRVAAEAMYEVREKSKPQVLKPGQWHLPYIEFGEDDYSVADWLRGHGIEDTGYRVRQHLAYVSAARCAQLSYLTQPQIDENGHIVDPGGKVDVDKDLKRYEMLTTSRPTHWSPLGHVATPWPQNRQDDYTHGLNFDGLDGVNRFVETNHLPRVGNLLAWRSLRTEVETQQGVVTFR